MLFPTSSVLISNPKNKETRGRILAQEVEGYSFIGVSCAVCCRVSLVTHGRTNRVRLPILLVS